MILKQPANGKLDSDSEPGKLGGLRRIPAVLKPFAAPGRQKTGDRSAICHSERSEVSSFPSQILSVAKPPSG
jgi:hypothetical protein